MLELLTLVLVEVGGGGRRIGAGGGGRLAVQGPPMQVLPQ